MKIRSLILGALLLLVTFALTACGGGGGNDGGGGSATIDYLPNFSFGSSTQASLAVQGFSSAALTLPEETDETDYYNMGKKQYYLFAPVLLGFIKESKSVSGGQVLDMGLLKMTVSISGKVVTLSGTLGNDGGTISVALNTENRTFTYEQFLKVQDGDNNKGIVYFKLDNVAMDENGGYQVNGRNVLCMIKGDSQYYYFAGQMDYYSGKGNANFQQCKDHDIVGIYGKAYIPDSPKSPPADILNLSKQAFLGYFDGKDSWNTPNNDDDPTEDESIMILCYDKTDDKFYSKSFGPDADKVGVDVASGHSTPNPNRLPWTLKSPM